ncbi:hypothetical protein, partial [Flavihumibacter sp. CACIAM 22H1]|uniref:hypothetical protein n=1 Tax=Flavihumibacter sp. CACIAM 22H1 TaxID=1812911 RepID=UPI0007A817CD
NIQNKIEAVLSHLGAYYHNLKGWRTTRKLLVLESDDWGSIRMRNNAAYTKLLKQGYPVDKGAFERFDQLESKQDLDALFGVLVKHRDANNRPAVFTANTILTNPDFEKIENSSFTEYHFELFTETYHRYHKDNEIWNYWMNGISDKVFWPQYHGREHYNVSYWMERLRNGDRNVLDAFAVEMVGIPAKQAGSAFNDLVVTASFRNEGQLQKIAASFNEGAELFKQVFGFYSKSFIAPVYTWNTEIEKAVYEKGVQFIQGGRYQKSPEKPNGKINPVYHSLGERNQFGQTYLVRNVFFEPSTQSDKVTHFANALAYIKAAFRMKKPAIVSTHRLNYMGGLNEKNRTENLALLDRLLKNTIDAYPEVEFVTSDELGELIAKG